MKYRELVINWGDSEVIFVTRGRSKPFTAEEAINYLTSRAQKTVESPNNEPVDLPSTSSRVEEVRENPQGCAKSWRIPADLQRERIFLRDFQDGIDFCCDKYGVDADSIRSEARRIAPHLSVPNGS